MFTKSWRQRIGWIGIVLVLLNVFVPTLSHALRAADPAGQRQVHREMVLAVAGDWCVSAGGSVKADDLRVIDAAVSLESTLQHLNACDFCDHAPLAGAVLPPPVVTGVDPAPLVVTAVRFEAFAAAVLRRHDFRQPPSHAPPQV
ncbi:DUF2946 family protein [Sphaerotilus sp.]|uniref:DUF2946 family protein n=1 Tax=Sphaerotilus sp. TaxID=2093942 RepID=UPI0034E29316